MLSPLATVRLVHDVVGTVCCRLENKNGAHCLYLMTMGVLAVRVILASRPVVFADSPPFSVQPYRNRTLGAQSLRAILDAAAASSKPKIDYIYLHVHSSNHDAIRFYEKNGFEKKDLVTDYYKRLQPRDAWILYRAITSST
jgi:N-alpha-acetyltransferase 50